jgi:hypothetical protein
MIKQIRLQVKQRYTEFQKDHLSLALYVSIISCFSSLEEYQIRLGMTKCDVLRHIGQALNAIPEAGEPLRQFLIQDMQNG